MLEVAGTKAIVQVSGIKELLAGRGNGGTHEVLPTGSEDRKYPASPRAPYSELNTRNACNKGPDLFLLE